MRRLPHAPASEIALDEALIPGIVCWGWEDLPRMRQVDQRMRDAGLAQQLRRLAMVDLPAPTGPVTTDPAGPTRRRAATHP